jgi:hypothetical protein
MIQRFFALLGLAISCPCMATDPSPYEIHVVRLSSVDLVEKKATADSPRRAGDLNEVVIDNGCGAFRAKFTVIETITGSPRHSLEVKGTIGEWCRLPFSASLNPQVVWLSPDGRGWNLEFALPAYEMKPSQYAIVPLNGVPCLDLNNKEAWTLVPEPIYLGGSATLSSQAVAYLRGVDALFEKVETVFAQRAVILTKGFDTGCSNQRLERP